MLSSAFFGIFLVKFEEKFRNFFTEKWLFSGKNDPVLINEAHPVPILSNEVATVVFASHVALPFMKSMKFSNTLIFQDFAPNSIKSFLNRHNIPLRSHGGGSRHLRSQIFQFSQIRIFDLFEGRSQPLRLRRQLQDRYILLLSAF